MSEYVRMRKSTMDSIAKAIQKKDGSTEKIPGVEMPDRIRAIQSDGDEIQWTEIANALRINSLNGLGKSKVEIHLPNAITLAQFCQVKDDDNVNTTVEELTIRCDQQVTAIGSMLDCSYNQYDRKLKKLTLYVDTGKATQATLVFQSQRTLEEIAGTPIDLSSATSIGGMFNYCNNLREVRFRGEIKKSLDVKYAEKLSKDSIISIISCLSNTTNGLSLTLSAKAVNTAFETSEGANDGSTSADWETLIAAHTNWTISLV